MKRNKHAPDEDPAWLDLPELGRLDFEFPKLDGMLANLPGLGFDLETLDMEVGRFLRSPKNARARDME